MLDLLASLALLFSCFHTHLKMPEQANCRSQPWFAQLPATLYAVNDIAWL
jgi:hypothetical protein